MFLGEKDAADRSHRAIDQVPKDIIMCDWHYELPEVYRKMGQETPFPSVRFFQEKGFRVLPGTWRTPEAGVALVRASRQGATDKMLGILFTGWDNGPGGEGLLKALRGDDKPGQKAAGAQGAKRMNTSRGIAATMKAGLKEFNSPGK